MPVANADTSAAYAAAEKDLAEFGTIHCGRFDVVEIMLHNLPVLVETKPHGWAITLKSNFDDCVQLVTMERING